MLRKRHFWLAIIALLAVVVIFIAPSVDLAPTVLRAWQATCAIFLAMAIASRTLAAALYRSSSSLSLQLSFSRSICDRGTSKFSCVFLC